MRGTGGVEFTSRHARFANQGRSRGCFIAFHGALKPQPLDSDPQAIQLGAKRFELMGLHLRSVEERMVDRRQVEKYQTVQMRLPHVGWSLFQYDNFISCCTQHISLLPSFFFLFFSSSRDWLFLRKTLQKSSCSAQFHVQFNECDRGRYDSIAARGPDITRRTGEVPPWGG